MGWDGMRNKASLARSGGTRETERKRTFGNSPSPRFQDPLLLRPSRAIAPYPASAAFGELHGHYALYLWHVSRALLSPHVEHIREEEVMQSFEVGLGVRGRSGSPSRFSTLSMVCKGQAIRDIWNIFETYGTFWRRIKDIHMDPAELRDKAKNMHMSFFLI